MATTSLPPQPTLSEPNQQFYNWLVALCAYIGRVYGVLVFPTWNQVATPGVNSTNPEEVDAFYLIAPAYQSPFYIGQVYKTIFGDSFSPVAAIVLATMSYPKPAPQPLAIPPVNVTPPPPVNPIGASFQDVGETDYVDLGSPNIPVGGTYTDPATGKVYVKQGKNTPFGMSTWFVAKQG